MPLEASYGGKLMASVSDPISGDDPYQPLTLGPYARKRQPLKGEESRNSAGRSRQRDYEAWREQITRTDTRTPCSRCEGGTP